MAQFTYNASALGAGGVIERDDGRVITTIPSIASVALAPTGGEGKTLISNYFSEELEFAHAETRVYGRQTRGVRAPRDEHEKKEAQFTTSTYVLIRNLRVFTQLHVGQMRATVTSTRGFEQDDDHRFELEASYTNIRIKGKEVIPRIDIKLIGVSRYQQLDDLLPELDSLAADSRKNVSAYVAGLARRFNAKNPREVATLAKRIRDRKAVQGSIVEHNGITDGPVIFIPGLGEAHFGELMIKPGRRRLNLLRINLGKPQRSVHGDEEAVVMNAAPMDEEESTERDLAGSITMGSVEGNGVPVEP